MPPYQIQPCIPSDIPRIFEVISLAFAHDHEYFDAIFPYHNTPKGREIGSERMLQIHHGDPNGTFIKAVDTETDEIVGAAKWNMYKAGQIPPQPEIAGEYWENEEDKEFAQALFRGFFTPRQKVIEATDGNLAALEMMMVDPAYQQKGVGRLLLRWGLARADELGVDAVVEGSDRGRRLYASEGFDGPHYVVPVPEKFATRRKQTYWWMRRPSQIKV